MEEVFVQLLLFYVAVGLFFAGFGMLFKGRDGFSRAATLFYWTIPSQLALRVFRGVLAGVTAFFAALTR